MVDDQDQKRRREDAVAERRKERERGWEKEANTPERQEWNIRSVQWNNLEEKDWRTVCELRAMTSLLGSGSLISSHFNHPPYTTDSNIHCA